MKKKVEYVGKTVSIMSCSKCNIKCKHCYILYDGDIEPETLKKMCETLTQKYQVIINGTEVLLNEEYLKSLAITKQKRVLTNGIVIYNNPSILKKLHNIGIKEIGLSYHYGIHNYISSVQYDIIKKVILNIQKSGLKVVLMCTINKDNYDKIMELCNETINLGIHGIRLTNYLRTGNAINLLEDNVLTEEQLNMFFVSLEKTRDKYSKEWLTIKRSGNFGKNINGDTRFNCIAGYEEVVIAPNMKVYPCIFMVKPGYEIGEYIDGKIMLERELTHNRTKCLAKELYNKI